MVEFAVTRGRSRRVTPPHPRRDSVTRGPARRATADPTATPVSGASWASGYRAKLRLSDASIIVLAVAAAFIVRFGAVEAAAQTGPVAARFAAMSLLVVAVWSASLWAFRSRDPRVIGVGFGEYRRVAHATTTTFGLLAIAFLVFQADTARWFFTVALPIGLFLLLLSRWLWRQWLTTQRAYGHFLSRVIVVGQIGRAHV